MFVGQKVILPHYYIQNVKYRIQIRVYNNSKERVTHVNLSILVKVKKILRKSQAPFMEKLGKLRLRQNAGIFI